MTPKSGYDVMCKRRIVAWSDVAAYVLDKTADEILYFGAALGSKFTQVYFILVLPRWPNVKYH